MSERPMKRRRTKHGVKSRSAVDAAARPSRKTAIKEDDSQNSVPVRGAKQTVSIAVPGSFIANAQSAELKTYVAGQIARAACIYRADEIVVFSDDAQEIDTTGRVRGASQSEPNAFLARVLEFLETPQYLRRHLFPIHRDFSCAGLLNPLAAPHHLRPQDISKFREGVVVRHDRTTQVSRPTDTQEDETSDLVYVGLRKLVQLPTQLPVGMRVTVQLKNPKQGREPRLPRGRRPQETNERLQGVPVSSREPLRQLGTFWGYTVRTAAGLGEALRKCPFDDNGEVADQDKGGKYDVRIGTSERGDKWQCDKGAAENKIPADFRHCIVVFGGVDGLETAVQGDESTRLFCAGSGGDPRPLFTHYIDACAGQVL
ncbi:MAG: hypothetical protein MHM6MM_002649 [Cercozoa sp. M6MM]